MIADIYCPGLGALADAERKRARDLDAYLDLEIVKHRIASRREVEALQLEHDKESYDWHKHINAGFNFTLPSRKCTLAELVAFDNRFIENQRKSGRDTKLMEERLAAYQENYACELRWKAEKQRRIAAVGEAVERKIFERDQRLSVMCGNELRSIVRAIILEVFNDKR